MTDVVSFTIQPIVVQFLKKKLLPKDDTKDTTVTKTLSHSLLLYIYAIHHSAECDYRVGRVWKRKAQREKATTWVTRIQFKMAAGTAFLLSVCVTCVCEEKAHNLRSRRSQLPWQDTITVPSHRSPVRELRLDSCGTIFFQRPNGVGPSQRSLAVCYFPLIKQKLAQATDWACSKTHSVWTRRLSTQTTTEYWYSW